MQLKKLVTTTAAMGLAAAMLLSGCGNSINKDDVLVSINGGNDTISLGYGNFAFHFSQAVYDQSYMSWFGEDMWTSDMGEEGTMEDSTKSNLMDQMEEYYLCKQHASEYNVALSDDDNAKIAEAVDKFMSSNSDKAIELMGATKEYATMMLEYQTYQKRVQNAIKDAAEVSVSEEEAWQRTFSYVKFSTTSAKDADGNDIEIDDAYLASQKVLADTLASSEDFDTTVEANGLTASKSSYTKGDAASSSMDAAIIDAAEALSEGQVSQVIEVENDGYYVIRLDADHDQEASATKKESLENEQRQAAYDEILDGWKEATKWDVKESNWKKVKVGSNLFKAAETEETTEE